MSESRGPKDDRRDAFGLARLGALNYRAKGYRCPRGDVVRVKN